MFESAASQALGHLARIAGIEKLFAPCLSSICAILQRQAILAVFNAQDLQCSRNGLEIEH